MRYLLLQLSARSDQVACLSSALLALLPTRGSDPINNTREYMLDRTIVCADIRTRIRATTGTTLLPDRPTNVYSRTEPFGTSFCLSAANSFFLETLIGILHMYSALMQPILHTWIRFGWWSDDNNAVHHRPFSQMLTRGQTLVTSLHHRLTRFIQT